MNSLFFPCAGKCVLALSSQSSRSLLVFISSFTPSGSPPLSADLAVRLVGPCYAASLHTVLFFQRHTGTFLTRLCLLFISAAGKWLACQSMDNQILIFGAQNRFRLNKKKIFKGHMVAGYACQVDFSPDMRSVYRSDRFYVRLVTIFTDQFDSCYIFNVLMNVNPLCTHSELYWQHPHQSNKMTRVTKAFLTL